MSRRMAIGSLSVVALLLTGAVAAECIGSGALQNCWDDSGNSYSVMRFGNSTFVDGRNARTGSSWSQSSQTLGNTTFHSGRAANGNSWNSSDTRVGDYRFINGQDSRGDSFSHTCGPFGCN